MEASVFQRPVDARRLRMPRRQRSDATLADRVRSGDERAFEELYDRHAASLLAFCRHLVGSREEAEDALQHTFLSAHRALEREPAPEHVKAWLYTVARNRCLSVLRARRDQVALDEEGAGWAGISSMRGLSSEVEERAELRALVGDLGRLPDDQRAALVLFELGDHSQDDIAAILGVRREKVKALVFQAREALIGWRAARDTPCVEVREQLSTLRGSALRRAPLRRHVELCTGCREFDEHVRRQRACLAVVLPVVPAAGLKSAVMSSVLGGGTAAAAATTAATTGTAGLGAAAVAKGVGVKALVALAIAGGAGGAGYVAVEQTGPAVPGRTPAVVAPAATASPGGAARATTRPASATTQAPAATPARRANASTSAGTHGRSSSSTNGKATRTRTRAHGTAGAPGQARTKKAHPAHPAQATTKAHTNGSAKASRVTKPAHTPTAQSGNAKTQQTAPRAATTLRVTPPQAAVPAAPKKTATVPTTPPASDTAVAPATDAVAQGGGAAKKLS